MDRPYLIETMRAVGGAIPLWPWHERRLQASMRTLGWPLLEMKAPVAYDSVVRLTVAEGGPVTVESRPVPVRPAVYRVGVSPVRVDSGDRCLYHKSSNRGPYVRAQQWAALHHLHDALLCNEAGFVTETSIANVIADVGGEWLTPPVADGLLPGVMRAVLLENGQAREEHLTVETLRRADALYLCNAVRGVFQVEYVPADQAI